MPILLNDALDQFRGIMPNNPRLRQRIKHYTMQSIPLPQLLLWHRSHEQYTLPMRVRPVIIGLTVLVMVLLGILGYVTCPNVSFHPSAQGYIYVNDKVMHFFGFMLVCDQRQF